MREILLTQNKTALIDDEDFELVSRYSWYAHQQKGAFYARTNLEGGIKLSMHNLILGPSTSKRQIDHRNGDGLDNRRSNLRFATPLENRRNQRLRSNNSSGYKGVSWHKQARKWMAYIKHTGKRRTYLGIFSSKEDAARAYDAAAKIYFGEFARLNFEGENSHG